LGNFVQSPYLQIKTHRALILNIELRAKDTLQLGFRGLGASLNWVQVFTLSDLAFQYLLNRPK